MKFTTKPGATVRQSNGRYLKTFKAGETTLRFLQETTEMEEYFEHWMDGQSFPCTRDRDTCPGCTSESEKVRSASRRYGTNVLLKATGQVTAFKVPATLYKRLELREQRHGTLTDRDYIVIRTGSNLDTEYDLESGDVYGVDVESLLASAEDINDILLDVYRSVFGDDDLPAPEEEKPKPVKKAAAKKAAPKPAEDVPPTEGEQVIDEADLFTMKLSELTELAVQAGISDDVISNVETKAELIGLITNAAG